MSSGAGIRGEPTCRVHSLVTDDRIFTIAPCTLSLCSVSGGGTGEELAGTSQKWNNRSMWSSYEITTISRFEIRSCRSISRGRFASVAPLEFSLLWGMSSDEVNVSLMYRAARINGDDRNVMGQETRCNLFPVRGGMCRKNWTTKFPVL